MLGVHSRLLFKPELILLQVLNEQGFGSILSNIYAIYTISAEDHHYPQASFGFSDGAIYMADDQYFCKNDSRYGVGDCTSREMVARAGQICSKCQVRRRSLFGSRTHLLILCNMSY